MKTLDLKASNTNSYSRDELEAYKQLRTNIEFTSLDKPIKVVSITSTDSAEAKTTTAINLAKVMANQKSRVLLIDADLRIPSIHKELKLSNHSGLSNCILNNDLDEANLLKYTQMVKIPNSAHELYVMPSGTHTPIPLELLSSKRFKQIMVYLKNSFNFIVIDSPAVLPVADTTPIANISDGVLFCIASHQTNKDRAQQAITQLKRINANILGIVLTMAPNKARQYYYNQYNYTKNSKTRTTLGHKLKAKNKKSITYPLNEDT